jgi:DNA sulfur modification protein DndC
MMAKEISGRNFELSEKSLQEIYREIQQVYLNYSFPWVIGYSGGKDSTTALQLIWYAISMLPVESRTNPVYVISSDTLVETPVIVDYITETLNRINLQAQKETMPFTAQKLSPQIADTFWVNLIGRGYPAPNNLFRWCTDRLKIQPSNRFILNKVAEHGEVILVLGIRQGESATRDQVINMHRVRGYQLARHGQLPGAWVFMPIEQFSTDDVWKYLLQVPSPWGSDNRNLASLYRSAQSGECPLVIDKTTPSCGNSRFGCWTCTVVGRDRSMEAMIDSGEEWMIPLLEFRDWLASTQDPNVKPQQREFKGRDGKVRFTGSGEVLYRTYTPNFSQIMLRRLLITQEEIFELKPGYELISLQELKEIRRLWITERQMWGDPLPIIYKEVTGKNADWEIEEIAVPGADEAEILNQIAQNQGLPLRLLQKLIDTEWQHYGMRRRASIHSKIEKILSEEWRSLDDVKLDINNGSM